jgi:hypothetical protein
MTSRQNWVRCSRRWRRWCVASWLPTKSMSACGRMGTGNFITCISSCSRCGSTSGSNLPNRGRTCRWRCLAAAKHLSDVRSRPFVTALAASWDTGLRSRQSERLAQRPRERQVPGGNGQRALEEIPRARHRSGLPEVARSVRNRGSFRTERHLEDMRTRRGGSNHRIIG